MNGSCNTEGQSDSNRLCGSIPYLYILTLLIGSHDLYDKEGDMGGDLLLAYVLNEPREIHGESLLALENRRSNEVSNLA